MSGDAERSLAELQALLESQVSDPAALEAAGERVSRALACLTRATPPAELSRILDLHAIVRETVTRRRDESAIELDHIQEGRARLARLTRPEDAAGSLDLEA